MIAKFTLTSASIIILLVFHNFYFWPLRIQVKTLIPASGAVFVVVLFWQLILKVLMK